MNFSELLNRVINGPVNLVGYGIEEITFGLASLHVSDIYVLRHVYECAFPNFFGNTGDCLN